MTNKIDINLNSIVHNLSVIKRAVDAETKVIGVVKANAYGHGLEETARTVWTSGADILAVNSIEEAVSLRVNKIKAPIIILSYVDPADYRKIIDFDLTLTIYDLEQARFLSREAQKQNRWARIDIKVDTGMNRYGFSPYDFLDNYKKILLLEHLKIEGIHSHFSSPSDKDFSEGQISEMKNVLFSLQQNNILAPMVHMAATEATFMYNEAHFDAVRVGLSLYGYYGFQAEDCEPLKPALSLKSKIAQIKRVAEGESVGYGRTFVAKKPMKIAVIPIGYYDGYPRSLSGKSEVLVYGIRTNIVGRICMNNLMIDVTGIKCVPGDEVVLIGEQKDEFIGADELSAKINTVPNEVLCRLSGLIPREYHFK